MVFDLLSNPTSTWFQLNETFYRREDRYDLIATDFLLSGYHLTCGENGGLIAATRDRSKLLVSSTKMESVHSVRILTSSGKLIHTIKLDTGTLIQVLWLEKDQLAILFSDGTIRLSTPFTELGQFSVPLDDGETVVDARSYHHGLVIRTTLNRFWNIEQISEPRPRLLAQPENPGEIHTWCIISPEKSLSQHVMVYVAMGDTILSIDHDQCEDQRLGRGPYHYLESSPNGSLLAMLNEALELVVVNSDFQQKKIDLTLENSGPTKMAWCSDDLVLVSFGSEVLAVAPFGQIEILYFDSDTHIEAELDGARIFSGLNCQFIQKVPDITQEIFTIGSTSPSALLFDALDHFEKRSPKCDELIRIIGSNLESAVDGCIQASGHEFDPSLQKVLLKAASYGKSFLTGYPSNRFVDMCKTLRVLNGLAHYDIGIPITYPQYKHLGIESVLNRLMHMHHYHLAFNLAQYLDLSTDVILIDWACEKIRNAIDDEETLGKILLDKIGNRPGLAYHRIAEVANLSGQFQLAVKLLELEPSSSKQVPMLLEMGEDDLALSRALVSGHTDLVYLVLLKLKAKLNLADYFRLLDRHPSAAKLFQVYASQLPDDELLKDYWYQADLEIELANHNLKLGLKVKELSKYEQAWTDTKKTYSKVKSLGFETKLIEDQIKLLAHQAKLSTPTTNLLGSTLADTIKHLCQHLNLVQADQLKSQFSMSDVQFWYLKCKGLILGTHFDELDKFAKSKVSPIGYKPIYDMLVEYRHPAKAIAYVARCDKELRPELYLAVQAYMEAGMAAAELGDLEFLKKIKDACPSPNLKREIDVLILQLQPNS